MEEKERKIMANSKKRIGRTDFVLRVLLISVLCWTFELLFRRESTFYLSFLSRCLQALEGVFVFGFLGVYLVKVISGRLLDAGLTLRYRFPAFLLWLLACIIPVIWPKAWPLGFVLFAVLLLIGGLFPGRQGLRISAPLENKADASNENTAIRPAPSKLRRIGPISFLRSLLTIACLSYPLILIGTSPVHGIWIWIARIGYFILGIIWLSKVLGRLEDIGWLSSSLFGYFSVGVILLLRILHRVGGVETPSHPLSFSIPNATRLVFSWMPWLRSINGYEILTVLLLIQVPLAFLPSKPVREEPASRQKVENRFGKMLAERRKTKKRFLVVPFAFLRRLTVLAILWYTLIYLDDVSKGGIGTWIARMGYFILVYAWMMNVHGRFEDAGWIDGWYGAQFCLVVSVAALMPMAAHWVSGYGALTIFVFVQVPIVFLKSRTTVSPDGYIGHPS